MGTAIGAKLADLQAIGQDLPLNLWMATVSDALAAVLPPGAALLKELESLRNQPTPSASFDPKGSDEAKMRRSLKALLDNAQQLGDLYKPPPPPPSIGDMVSEIKEKVKRDVDTVITEQFVKHWVFRVLCGLLVSLILAFLGIDFWFSKQVTAAQQTIAKMQDQVNGAKAAIFEKESDLNKALRDGQSELSKSVETSKDLLNGDFKKSEGVINWVEGDLTQRLKNDEQTGSKNIGKVAADQISDIRKEGAAKRAGIENPYVVWLLGVSWLVPLAAFAFSVLALFFCLRAVSTRSLKRRLGLAH